MGDLKSDLAAVSAILGSTKYVLPQRKDDLPGISRRFVRESRCLAIEFNRQKKRILEPHERKQALKLLSSLERKAKKLLIGLDDMKVEAEVLTGAVPLEELKETLVLFASRIPRGKKGLNELPAIVGARLKERDYHRKQTALISNLYEEITGKKPGRTIDPQTSQASGPFFLFVRDLFNALKIEASPESQIRIATKKTAERKCGDSGALPDSSIEDPATIVASHT